MTAPTARQAEQPSGWVTLDPSPETALHELLMSTPPLREFQEGVPNTYVFSEACEIEATLSNGCWTLHSVTVR